MSGFGNNFNPLDILPYLDLKPAGMADQLGRYCAR
jgi:hypothetical protein